jgi:hypothetical protein
MKPINRKAYGSIGHLPESRLGPSDRSVPEGQARICTEKTRDSHDKIIVQEKLDGSCVAVAMVDGVLHAIGRAGWPAISSPYEQHRLFAQWVHENEASFREVLLDGERIVGEWVAQAHGTLYDLPEGEGPFFAFDIMRGDERATFGEFSVRVQGLFKTPALLHVGSPMTVRDAMKIHAERHSGCDEPEGVVYRVERRGKVDFLAKWVRPDKVDGKYFDSEVWNWRPISDFSL